MEIKEVSIHNIEGFDEYYCTGIGFKEDFNMIKFPNCILEDDIFTLIIRECRTDRNINYLFLELGLLKMKKIIIKNNIKFISLPRIEFDILEMDFNIVENMLYRIFKDLDISIIIWIM